MSEEDLKEILDACRPTPVMKIGNYTGSTPQENANRAWQRLGERMGFDHMTVQPTGRGYRFFTAVPSETEEGKKERLAREAEATRLQEIETGATTAKEIALQKRIDWLELKMQTAHERLWTQSKLPTPSVLVIQQVLQDLKT